MKLHPPAGRALLAALFIPVFAGAGSLLRARTPAATGTDQHRSPAAPVVAGPRAAVRLVPAHDGNEARYRVRERLARFEFPTDAVGKTTAVSGALALDDSGNVITDQSRFTVDLASVRSDNQRRDGFVRRRTIVTDSFPNAVFAPATITGLTLPLPADRDVAVTVAGDLTIHGKTRPATWAVSAHATADGYAGTAQTEFTFEDFGMTVPRLGFLLSVSDTIHLEYDFHLVPEASSGSR